MIRDGDIVMPFKQRFGGRGNSKGVEKATMAPRRPSPANRAMRELGQALARIQAEGGTPDRVLRKRAEVLLAHLADLPVAMLVADNRGRYVDVNAAAVLLTGYSRAELLR
jgi:PAS domain-containing protein